MADFRTRAGEGTYEPDSMPGKPPEATLARAAARGVRAAVLCGEVADESNAANAGDRELPEPRIYPRSALYGDRPRNRRADLADLGEPVVRQELGG